MIVHKYIRSWIIIVFGISLSTCISPVDLNVPDNSGLLVVEGNITTDRGPYDVRLSRSTPIGDDIVNQPVSGAAVIIFDDLGISEQLLETTSGVYQTSIGGIQGEVGRAYSIRIEIGDQVYESSPDTLFEGSSIDSLQLQVENVVTITDVNVELTDTQVNVLASTQDIPGAENFYQWSFKELEFEIRSNITFGCCNRCIVSENIPINSGFNTLSDNGIDGNMISDIPVFSIIPDFRLVNLFSILIEQRSLSPTAFNFFQLVQRNLDVGTIFDPTLGAVEGNVENISNPDEQVLGLFYASDISEKRLLFSLFDVRQLEPVTVTPVEFNGDCRSLFTNSSTDFPPYWLPPGLSGQFLFETNGDVGNLNGVLSISGSEISFILEDLTFGLANEPIPYAIIAASDRTISAPPEFQGAMASINGFLRDDDSIFLEITILCCGFENLSYTLNLEPL